MHLPVVQLLPFEYSQARQLIDRLVGDPDTVEILREGLASLRSHMSLSPLAVSLLMDIAEAERQVPGTIGEIFEQYMDIASRAIRRRTWHRSSVSIFHQRTMYLLNLHGTLSSTETG